MQQTGSPCTYECIVQPTWHGACTAPRKPSATLVVSSGGCRHVKRQSPVNRNWGKFGRENTSRLRQLSGGINQMVEASGLAMDSTLEALTTQPRNPEYHCKGKLLHTHAHTQHTN